MVEDGVQLRRALPQCADFRQIPLVAGQRGLPVEAAMRGAVVDLLDPGPQPGVEVVQPVDPALVQFAEELVAEGAVPALQLAFALRRVRPAVNQVDAQPGACKVWARYAEPLSTTSFLGRPRFNTACFSTPSMSRAVSPRQKALWATRREASSIRETR